MDGDWAEATARRLQVWHGLSFPATDAELLRICEDRGCDVIRSFELRRTQGLYLRLPEPLIIVRAHAPVYVLAHELAHHLLAELADWDDEEQYVYAYHSGQDPELEWTCDRFAEVLCGAW